MNRIYRVIFNVAVGAWQVVSELVSATRGLARGSSNGTVTAALKPAAFALWCAMGMVTLVSPLMAQEAQGRILVDRAAPGDQRPMVVEAPSGAPLVNIATPSTAGVSRNRYSQFDVGTQGAILNNSRRGADTVLGGQVLGNPNLATGTAKVILNEVNGPVSQLNGYVEVGGDRAAVVIANPSGIVANGTGFINASRVTLTTGTPLFSGTSLDGYRVDGGTIRADGAGLDATRADYTDLISRSLELNGQVWAKQLQATLGTNTVSVDHTLVAAHATEGSAPQFALDASALGGMYANKISLVGTEQGVGVRNAGTIGAQAGELAVTADGRLENTGKLQAQTNTRINATSGIANAGTISAGREVAVTTGADVDNSGGTLNAQRIEVNAAAIANRGGTIEQAGPQGLALDANNVTNRDGGRIGLAEPVPGGGTGGAGGGGSTGGGGGGGSGGSSDGDTGGEIVVLPMPETLSDGVLNIAGTLNNDGGKINAGGGVQLNTASGIDNGSGHLGLRELSITQGDLLNDGGELIVTGDMRVHASRIDNDAGRLEVGGALNLDAQTISNRAGTISHSGTTDARVHTRTFDNVDGILATNASALDVSADAVANERGRIEHSGNGGLNLHANTLNAADGAIITNGAATLVLGQADHRGATLSATQLTVTAADFDNRGGHIVATGTDANTISVTGTLDNSDEGNITGDGDVSITAGTFGNAGGIVRQAGAGTLAIDAATLEGTGGTLASNGALSITGATTNLRDGTTAAQQIAIETGRLTTAGGTLAAGGTKALEITAHDSLDNTGGTIATNGVAQVSAGSLSNTDGTISAAGTGASAVTVGNTLDNSRGTLAAGGTLGVRAAALVNRDTRAAEGETASTGIQAAELSVRANSIDNGNGQMAAAGTLNVKTDLLDNSHGSLSSGNAMALDTATLVGADGTIGTNGALSLTGNMLDLSDATTFAQSINVDVGTLLTAGGMLSATGADVLKIDARDAVDNAGGVIATNGALDLTVGTDTIDTCDGIEIAVGTHCGALDNTGGTISAAGADASKVTATGRIDNTGGLITGNGAVELDTASLVNRDTRSIGPAEPARGVWSNQLTVDARSLDNTNGQLGANDTASLTSRTLGNSNGAIAAANALTVNATTLNGAGGTLGTNGALTLTGETLSLSGGTTSAQTIIIDTGDMTTANGTLIAAGSDALRLNVRHHLDNNAGTIATNGAIQLNAGSANNSDGVIQAAGTGATDLRIASTLDNTHGTLATAGATSIKTGDLINTAGLVQAASDSTLTLDANGHLDNSDGTIVANGAIAATAQSLTNAAGVVQTQQGITANVLGALDNNGGLMVAGEDLTASAGVLVNRDTIGAEASAPTGLFGQRVTLNADTLDNAHGQVVANDALTLRGKSQAGTALNNTSGVFDGVGTTTVNATSFDNTGGQLVQRGADGGMALGVTGTLINANGLIGAEGIGNMQAGSLDNSAGTITARDLTLSSDGDLRNAAGAVQSGGSLAINAGGTLDNTDGVIDTAGVTVLTAASIDNVRGQVLAGGDENDVLTVNATALNNQSGVIGTRAGDAVLNVADIDSRGGGRLVADRDLTFNSVAVDISGGVAFANRDLNYVNSGARLTNAGGQFGAGKNARLTLANVSNTADGLIQAGVVWLSTPFLDIEGGKVVGNEVHAQLTTLSGAGQIYGAQWLNVDINGDYTYGTGPRFESDVLLDLTVAGTFTNSGRLQTPGELALTAGSVINEGYINASNADGNGYAHITAGSIENRRGAKLEGDWLELNAAIVNNTADIVGDNITIAADTLMNGRDLGTALAAANYGEGFIGAASYLDLRANTLANLDGDIFSGGDLGIAGRDGVTRAMLLRNVSGRIQAEGNTYIAANDIDNARRVVGSPETYTLSADEAYALSSQRDVDAKYAALSPADRADYDRIAAKASTKGGSLTAAEKVRLAEVLEKLGWERVGSLTPEMYAAADAELNRIAIAEYGARSSWMIENPSALVRQNDTYTTGQRLNDAQTSAESQIITGGDLTLDSGGVVRNYASRIAAGGNLTITGTAYDPDSQAPRVENIAVVGEYGGNRATTAWIFVPPVKTRYTDGRGTHETIAEFSATMNDALTTTGPVLADATITAGKGVFIEAGDVTNGAVTAGTGLNALSGGSLNEARSTDLGSANGTNAAGAGGVDSASGNQIGNGQGASAAQGGTASPSIGPSGAAPQFIGTADRPLPGVVADDNGMFDVDADPSAGFLVTTAPRFAKGGPWDGSDYLLRALQTDPSNIHKRLGDGYYEHRLVMEQVFQLTGRRSLSGDGDASAQYRVLMDNAAATAGRLGLQLGAPLTSAQIASLDCDIVWLVEQEVNGQKVLVPVVYLSKATAERMAANGALIDGDTLSINSTGTVKNDGTLSANKGAFLSADTLINDGKVNGGQFTGITTRGDTVNTGRIEGSAVAIDAGGSVINTVRFDGINATGGVIQAGAGRLQIDAKVDVINQGQIASAGHAVVTAGRDFVQNAATNTTNAAGTIKAPEGSLTTSGSAAVNAGRDVVLDQSSINAWQHAIIDAGRDAHFTAAEVTAGRSMAVTAGRDIVSDAVTDTTTMISTERVKEGKKKTTTTTTTADQTVRGSTFQAGGNIAMVAETGNIDLTAATVRSEDGGVTLSAEHGDVNLRAGYETDTLTQDTQSKKRNTLSTTTTTSHLEVSDTTAVGTTISGKTVGIAADNILVSGSNVVSDDGTTLIAKQSVTIENVYDTHEESYSSSKKKSGVFSNGGASITAGSQKQTLDSHETGSYVVGSMVGSLHGDTTVIANDGTVHVKGSTIASPEGGVTLLGNSVNIEEAHNTVAREDKTSFKQSGVTLSLSAPVLDAALGAYESSKTTGESKDSRVNAMAAANTAYHAYQAGSAVSDVMSGAGGGGATLSLTYGKQKSESEATTTSREAVGSKVNGQNVTIAAIGGGDASTIRISGSDVYGSDSATLYAEGGVDVVAADNTHEQHSENSSNGWNAGVAVSYGSGGWAAGVTAGGNAGRGGSDGTTVTHTNSHVGSGGTTSVTSGGTLTLSGGQIAGERVAVDVKNLVIESLQDTQTYDSEQKNASAQVTVGYGASVSASYNQSNINADYASVTEQSGILAGDGGYSVKVRDKTQLTGGIITSTEAAEAAGRNSFSTGTLEIADIENHADCEGSSLGISGGVGVNGSGERGEHQAAQGSADGKAGGIAANKTVGFGQDDDHQSSTTRSGINTANVTITDEASQAATGKTIDQIKTEVATATTTDTVVANSGALVNRFNAAAVQKELDTQQQVTQSFDHTQQGVRSEINTAIDEARQRGEDAAADLKSNPNLTQEQQAALVAEAVDAQKDIDRLQKVGVLVNVITAGLSSPADGAGGIATTALAPGAAYLIGQHFKENAAKNVVDNDDRAEEGSATHLLTHALLGAAVGASGGGDGALLAALAAGGAEAAAPALAKYMYGKDAADLTAEEKETIGAIVGVGGAMLGGLGNDVASLINSSSTAQSAANNNWGEVGHYSTMATVLYLAGFSEQDAKAVALAAWSPDTDKRNAITVDNFNEGTSAAGNQQSYHLLDGETDPAKVKAKQQELGQQVVQILNDLKRYEDNPAAKAAILSNPETQKVLHAFGDSYAHVQDDGTHYVEQWGHLKDGTDPDNPNLHQGAYTSYVSALYGIATSVAGTAAPGGVSGVTRAVVDQSSDEGQKAALAAAARAAGSRDAGLVNSPVTGCEFTEQCGGNTANAVIQEIYGVKPSVPVIDWSKVSFPSEWTRR